MAGLLLGARPAASHDRVIAPDANAIVRRMVAAYQSAQTIQETCEARIFQVPGGEYVQSTTIRFKRPNLLCLTSQDPNLGTYIVYGNGKTVTVYSGRQNIYTKRTSPTKLRAELSTISSAAEELIHSAVSQALNPLSFLNAKGMPDECQNFAYIREAVVDGRQVAIVSGPPSPTWLAGIPGVKDAIADKSTITLYIDTTRNLLVKAACDLNWHVSAPATPNVPASVTRYRFKFSEVHRNTVLNLPLRDEEFFFIPPRGAAEQFNERH